MDQPFGIRQQWLYAMPLVGEFIMTSSITMSKVLCGAIAFQTLLVRYYCHFCYNYSHYQERQPDYLGNNT